MSDPETQPSAANIPEPVEVEPEAGPSNIFGLDGTDTPDLESQEKMGEYLISRLEPDDGARTRVVWTPSGRTRPALQREQIGFKEVSRWRKTKDWLINPRLAAIVMLGSAALFNGIGNHASIAGAAEYAGHEIYRVFEPVQPHKITVSAPGPTEHISQTVDTHDKVGISTVSPSDVQSFVTRLDQAISTGSNVESITIVGNTSDEWAGISDSIGVPNEENAELGQARVKAAEEALTEDGVNLNKFNVTITSHEHVLAPQQEQTVLEAAEADGFPTITSAVKAVDNGETVSPTLGAKIKQFFSGKLIRGVTITANVKQPGRPVTSTKEVPGKDNPPNVPSPHWYWFIPMLPIRKRERYDDVRPVKQWKFTPSKPIMRPEIVREDIDQAWVRLRPEAKNEDGTLVDQPWAYTRDYENLLREGRINDMLRADYTNAKGEAKSLRVMFVDHSPAEETVSAFEELLRKFAAMEDGQLGERVSGIFVFPSENAGTEHGDPKRSAMGIDKQSSADILGTFTYVLGLIELHMPTDCDTDQLQEILVSFNGPKWVMSHEVAGHGTDVSDEQLRLRQVRARGIPNAHLVDGEPRAKKMQKLDKVLSKLAANPRKKKQPVEFDIVYPVTDNDGQTVTVKARVAEGDPRLAHASSSTIVGHKPTKYAGTNASEHYAETAASVTTGITVPYDEASVKVDELAADTGQPAVFADCYRPDERGQHVFTESVGAQSGSFPVDFSNQPDVTISHIDPAEDPLIRRELIRARRSRTLEPSEMVAILARMISKNRRGNTKRG